MKSSSYNITLAAFALLLLASSVHAESWELLTADEEVQGTRDIEAGRIDKGIKVLEANYSTTPYHKRSAVLANLCMAHALKRNYDTAMNYCEQAVQHRTGNRESYNNRGVLHALTGNYSAAIADFRKAGCLRECPEDLVRDGNKRMDVAKRNLNRAQVQLAVQEQQRKEQELQAAQ